MCVRPFLPGLPSLVLEDRHVLEAGILLEVRDSRAPHAEHMIDFVVAETRKALVVLGRFHPHFMSAKRPHFVVDAFRSAAGIGLYAIQRLWMRHNADLPGAFRGPGQDGFRVVDGRRIEGTSAFALFRSLALPGYNPTLRDRISANFHGVF